MASKQKKPKPVKTTKSKPKAPAAPAKPAKAAKSDKAKKVQFNSPMNVGEQKLFMQHLPAITLQKDKVASAVADLRNLYKKAKEHGFDKADFDLAAAIDTAEKEAKTRSKIARQLTIAKYCGKELGAQLDLFMEPVRTPSSEIAYEEGKIASMQHAAAKPGYDPSTEQHREYMRGYHEVQAQQVKDGIGKTETTTLIPKAAKAVKEKPAPAPVKEAEPPAMSPGGMRMTRSDYIREQEANKQANKQAAEQEFKPTHEFKSEFQRKPAEADKTAS